MKKYNYKYIIGFIIGIILFGSTAFAVINYSANMFFYDKTSSTLNSDDVQSAIDELANTYSNFSSCPSDKICFTKKTSLAIGDYINYTPEKTTYNIDISKTGNTFAQTIDPSELNLWRVISINGNGTVDIISEYTSSKNISFYGLTGFKNYIGYLNVIASQYETPGITTGSRYFGYSTQTQYITSDTYFTTTVPWKCSTGATCSPDPDNYELYGGGDSLYLNDYNLVQNALGTLQAYRFGTSQITDYWLAGRYYQYLSTTSYRWSARYIQTSGTSTVLYLYAYSSSKFNSQRRSFAVRPIVRLKSGLAYSGVGSKLFPMEIQS